MFTPAARIDLIPHCSLSTRGALLFFGITCAGTFLVAGAATAVGFWPVLPFAGVEMLLLGWALRNNLQRRFDGESIQVSDTEIVISHASGKHPSIVFPRHWARVKIRRPKSPLHRGRLFIESHGRAREVGKFLTEEERHQLAARLGLLIGGTNQSPALPPAGSPEQFS